MAYPKLYFTVTSIVFLIQEATPKAQKSTPYTCVIGAGYGGLATARYLKRLGVDFTVFEAQRGIGGVWRSKTDLQEDGLPSFPGTYIHLRTNTPRQTMEFANFSFPATTPSYPSGSCFYKYLQYFAKESGIEKYIQLRSLVTSVKWADKRWEITYKKTDTNENHIVTCDFVVVSIGHYNKPKVPKFEGQDSFTGKIIHSQQYKDPEVYRNRRVLLIGAGPSGLDLVTHLSEISGRLVHSHHLQYNQPQFSANYVKKPDVKMFLSNGAVFIDDSFEELDDVILCTGYDFDFPFLDESCGLTLTSKFVVPVYRHMVNIRRPTMVVMALTTPTITRTLDAQAEYAAALVGGKFKLPSPDEMFQSWLQHLYALKSKGKTIVDVNTMFDDMDQYFANLSEEAGTARVAPVLTDIRDHDKLNRFVDLLNYRDYEYQLLDSRHYKRWYNPKNETCDIDIKTLI